MTIINPHNSLACSLLSAVARCAAGTFADKNAMRTKNITVKLLALLCSAIFVGSSFAIPSSISSRAALGGNDSVNWGALGIDGANLGPNVNTTSASGLGVTGTRTSTDGFERTDQGGTWGGNFASGDALLWTGIYSLVPETITIEFGSPVFGAGAQIQNDFPGAFRAYLKSYDSGGALLWSDSFVGESTSAGNNSAIFIGVLDSFASISKIEISVENGDTFSGSFSESFAINRLDLRIAQVPDSGEYLSALFAATILGMGALCRSRRQAAA